MRSYRIRRRANVCASRQESFLAGDVQLLDDLRRKREQIAAFLDIASPADDSKYKRRGNLRAHDQDQPLIGLRGPICSSPAVVPLYHRERVRRPLQVQGERQGHVSDDVRGAHRFYTFTSRTRGKVRGQHSRLPARRGRASRSSRRATLRDPERSRALELDPGDPERVGAEPPGLDRAVGNEVAAARR